LITDLPRVVSPGTDLDSLLRFSDRWQTKMLPSLLLKQMAHEIALMQALHHYNDRILLLIVETRDQCGAVPFNVPLTSRVGHRVSWFKRIINDDHIPAAPG
jgi:hypothetical protein